MAAQQWTRPPSGHSDFRLAAWSEAKSARWWPSSSRRHRSQPIGCPASTHTAVLVIAIIQPAAKPYPTSNRNRYFDAEPTAVAHATDRIEGVVKQVWGIHLPNHRSISVREHSHSPGRPRGPIVVAAGLHPVVRGKRIHSNRSQRPATRACLLIRTRWWFTTAVRATLTVVTIEQELFEGLMARIVNRRADASVLIHVRYRHLLASAVPVMALLVMGCSGPDAPAGTTPVRSSSAVSVAPAGVDYLVHDYMFPPLTVAPGAVVNVRDGDDEPTP